MSWSTGRVEYEMNPAGVVVVMVSLRCGVGRWLGGFPRAPEAHSASPRVAAKCSRNRLSLKRKLSLNSAKDPALNIRKRVFEGLSCSVWRQFIEKDSLTFDSHESSADVS